MNDKAQHQLNHDHGNHKPITKRVKTLSVTVVILLSTVVTFAQGLTGEYFDNADFTGRKLVRIDKSVSIGEPGSADNPGPSEIFPESFSIRWRGYLLPETTETYTLQIKTSNTFELIVNGQPLLARINQPGYRLLAAGQIDLQEGVAYPIELRFAATADQFEQWDIKLFWESDTIKREIISGTSFQPLPESTWDGGGETNNWSEAANWSDDALPAADTLVTFDGASDKPALVDTDITIRDLAILPEYMAQLAGGKSTLNLHGNLSLTDAAQVDMTNATLNLAGSTGQRVDGAVLQWKRIQVKNIAGLVAFRRGVSANKFTALPGTKIQFASGDEVTVGKLTANGLENKTIELSASEVGSPWQLVTNSSSVSHIKVSDSDASAGPTIDASNGGIDAGGNAGWNFDQAGQGNKATNLSFTPEKTQFLTSLQVQIVPDNPTNTTIYFTTDNTLPTQASPIYTLGSNITLDATTTIQAISVFEEGGANEDISKVFGQTFAQFNAEELYVRKTYGSGAILSIGDVRRFTAQVWWVGPDGEPDNMAGDDVRMPQFDNEIEWSANGGATGEIDYTANIEKIPGDENGGAAIYRSAGIVGNRSSYFISVKIGPNSFTGCNNSEPEYALVDAEWDDCGECIAAAHCTSGTELDFESCNDLEDSSAVDGDCFESPIPLPSIGEKIEIHIVSNAGAYNLAPFSFGRSSRSTGFHELTVISPSQINIRFVNRKTFFTLAFKDNGDGQFFNQGGDESFIEALPTGADGYRLVRDDKAIDEFTKIAGLDADQYRLTKKTDKSGNVISYDYTADDDDSDSDDYMVITDASNNEYQISADVIVDDIRLISKIVTKSGLTGEEKTWTYTYDDDGFVTSERFEELFAEFGYGDYLYTFDVHGNMTEFTDYNGNVYRTEYDDTWRSIKFILPDGQISDRDYDAPNGLFTRVFTDPEGNISEAMFNQTPTGLQVVREIAADGLISQYEYNKESFTTKKIEKLTDEADDDIITTYEYDAFFNKTRITVDPEGLNLITQYSYDANGNRIQQVDPNGVITDYVYDANNRLIKETIDPNGLNLIKEYGYDNEGRKIKAIDEEGFEREWIYDDFGQVIEYRNEQSNSEFYTYDEFGNKISYTDRNNNTTTYAYDPLNRLTLTIDPQDFTEERDYDGNDNLIRLKDEIDSVTIFNYNSLDHRIEITGDAAAPGGCSSCGGTAANGTEGDYEYNFRGDLIKYTDIEGLITLYEYDPVYRLNRTLQDPDELAIETHVEYDRLGRKTRDIAVNQNGPDVITDCEYDKASRKVAIKRHINGRTFDTLYAYDKMHHILAVTDPNGNVSTKEYDNDYLVVRTTDPEGLVIENTYNARDEVVEMVRDPEGANYITGYTYDERPFFLTVVDEPDGGVTTLTYDAHGNRLTTTDPNGNTMTYIYDSRHSLVKTIDPAGFETSYTYDGLKNQTSITDADNMVTRFVYDAKSFRIQEIGDEDGIHAVTTYARDELVHPTGGTDAFNVPNETVLDAVYRPIAQISDVGGINVEAKITYDSINRQTNVTDAGGFVRTYEYDQLSRLVRETMPDGGEITFEYDKMDHVLKKTQKINDSQSMATTYEYDKRYLVTQEIQDAENLAITTTREYDILKRLTSNTDSNGNTTAYTYDEEDRILTETYADGGVIQYEYDQKGRLLKKTDQVNEVCLYIYESRDLLIEKTFGSAGVQTFAYDSLRRMVECSDNNENRIAGGGVACSKTYDKLHRMTSDTQIVAGKAKTIIKEYDPYGHVIRCIYPGGRQVKYTYTNLHQVDKIKTNKNDMVNTDMTMTTIVNHIYEYDRPNNGDKRPLIRNRKFLQPNIRSSFKYDEVGRKTQIKHNKPGKGTLVGFAYDYDVYGNRLRGDQLHRRKDSESFAYDTAQRLTDYSRGPQNQTPQFRQDWTLDDLGNWTQFDDNGANQVRSHNEVNEVTDINGGNLTYDDKGNLTSDDTYDYHWDVLNRLTQIKQGAVIIATYAYNGENFRVYKNTDDKTTRYYHCNQKVVEEYQNNKEKPQRQYVWCPDYIDELALFIDKSGKFNYPLCDLRYSIYAFVNKQGNVKERYNYDAYGKRSVMKKNFQSRITANVGQDYGYTGRRHDREGGELMYFRARYYDAGLGRFIGRDPIGYIDGMNLYGAYFVPLYTDSKGTHCFDCQMIYDMRIVKINFNFSKCINRADRIFDRIVNPARILRNVAIRLAAIGLNTCLSGCAEYEFQTLIDICELHCHFISSKATSVARAIFLAIAVGAEAGRVTAKAACLIAKVGTRALAESQKTQCDAEYGLDDDGCPCPA